MANYSKNYDIVRNMFWDGKDEQGKQLHIDKNGITHAIARALKDYTSRTDKKTQNETTASVTKMLEALPEFVDAIIQYFNQPVKATPMGYDEWHHQRCEQFISCIISKKIRTNVTYGKAQKIVNMAMKTIYCLEGARQYADNGYFDYCHMPLDSIVLNWFKTYVAKQWYNVRHPYEMQIRIAADGPIPSWSKLSFLDGSLSVDFDTYDTTLTVRCNSKYYHYMFLVTVIREYFKQGNSENRYDGLTPLEAEFYIWPEMQYEQAAQALLKQDLINKLKSNPGVTTNNTAIQNLNTQLVALLGDLSVYY